jgi:hypothetical protein
MNDAKRVDEVEPFEPGLVGQKKWTRGAQRIASVMWPSFLAAAVGSIVFFTFFDPELLGVALMPEREFSALTGYGMCFFFFWCIALLSSALTTYLRRTRRRESGNGDPGGLPDDDRPDGTN